MKDNRIMTVIDEDGKEKEMRVLFAKNLEKYNKNYVFYLDPTSNSGQVFVSALLENQQLQSITDEEEWKALEGAFQEFLQEIKQSSCGHCSENDDCSCENCHDCERENEN